MNFSDLNINRFLLDALDEMGFSTPTPIQEKAFPEIMSGKDLVGIAQTGTGKTFAYLLPILRQLTFSKQKHPRVLIVVPTRELVVQVVAEIESLTPYINIRFAGVYGGTNLNKQKGRKETLLLKTIVIFVISFEQDLLYEERQTNFVLLLNKVL